MNDQSHKVIQKGILFFSFSLLSTSLFAAQAIDLTRQSMPLLKGATTELNRAVDPQGMTHIRMQQTVNGYPVWGGDYVMHVPAGKNLTGATTTMSGTVYQNIEADLTNTPTIVFSAAQKQSAIATIIKSKLAKDPLRGQPEANLIVYVDQQNKAHWAYHLRFTTAKAIPSFIVDAVDFNIYQQWNDLKTLENVTAGGLGGNRRVGMQYYDGLTNHLPTLTIQRDPVLGICYLRNDKAVLKSYQHDFEDIQFNCEAIDRKHGMYWDSQEDSSGGGYSPSNDTLYAAGVTWDMFQNWYHMPMWKDKNGKAKRLVYFMHDSDANAAFHEDGYIVLGDCLKSDEFFPFTTIDIIAHEIGHGVTYQHANLKYYGQSGGLNESFSDMTGKTADLYANGSLKNWNLGENKTDESKWLRYMDHPNKDCEEGDTPGKDCSIENMSQIPADGYMEVHYSSGLYNRVFYLLATSPDWDAKKAYELMLHANRYYWTSASNFCQAARGVLLAAKELGVDEKAILNAFSQVGIDPQQCV